MSVPPPVRFAILGCGNIGGLHATAIAAVPDARLVAVCDTRREPAATVAHRYGARYYTDYRQMVRQDDVDVVNICTPSGAHLEPVLAAAAAGKHVVCEKPLEVTLDRVDRMIAACEHAGVWLATILPLRFAAASRCAFDAIRAGRLGRLLFGEVNLRWWRSQAYYDADGWRGTWALDGGGALMNQGIHRVDLLQWLMGPVKSVVASTDTRAHERVEVEDLAVGIARFRTGAMASIVASTALQPGFPARVAVYGSEGVIELEEGAITTWKMKGGSPQEERGMSARFRADGLSASSDPMGISQEGHVAQITDMIRAVREHRAPVVDGRAGRCAIAIVSALYQSARTGRWVDVPEDGCGAHVGR